MAISGCVHSFYYRGSRCTGASAIKDSESVEPTIALATSLVAQGAKKKTVASTLNSKKIKGKTKKIIVLAKKNYIPLDKLKGLSLKLLTFPCQECQLLRRGFYFTDDYYNPL